MEKKLTEMTITEFIDTLASDAPAPGGGSASALVAALGMGLAAMTASLTTGRKKYEAMEPVVQAALAACLPLTAELTADIDRDTEAFTSVMAALSLPRENDEEKAARRQAVETATRAATLAPFSVMERCRTAVGELEKLVGNVNPNCVSDLGVAALCIRAAVAGAWLNVCINLPGIHDAELVARYRHEGSALLADVERRATAVYDAVNAA